MFECISQKADIALYADDTKIWRGNKNSLKITLFYRAILINFLHGQIEIK